MIAHLAKGVNDPAETFANGGEDRLPGVAVAIIPKYGFLTVAARRDVVNGTSKFQTKWPAHGSSLTRDGFVGSLRMLIGSKCLNVRPDTDGMSDCQT
jgi:hypothetical protein